jgi:hypothetical protein
MPDAKGKLLPYELAIVVVLVVLILMYILYPIYFEYMVLMKIPEYSNLKQALNDNKAALKSLQDGLGLQATAIDSAASATPTELMVLNEEISSLTDQVKSLKDQLASSSSTVVELRRQMGDASASETEWEDMYNGCTAQLKIANDTMIPVLSLKNQDLARKLQGMRDTLLLVMSQSRDMACAQQPQVIANIGRMAQMMRQNQDELHAFCSAGGMSGAFPSTSAKRAMASGAAPFENSVMRLYGDMEDVLTYIVANSFCDASTKFRIDEFEKYLIRVVGEMCKSDDWRSTTSAHLDYVLKKPFSYLPGEPAGGPVAAPLATAATMGGVGDSNDANVGSGGINSCPSAGM